MRKKPDTIVLKKGEDYIVVNYGDYFASLAYMLKHFFPNLDLNGVFIFSEDLAKRIPYSKEALENLSEELWENGR